MRRTIVLLLLVAVFGGCSESKKPSAVASGTGTTIDTCTQELEQLQVREAEILAMITNLACSANSNCTSIAFGRNTCGKPERYLIYSKSNVNEPTLKTRVSEYNELETQRNGHCSVSTACPTVAQPGTVCSLGTCRAR